MAQLIHALFTGELVRLVRRLTYLISLFLTIVAVESPRDRLGIIFFRYSLDFVENLSSFLKFLNNIAGRG